MTAEMRRCPGLERVGLNLTWTGLEGKRCLLLKQVEAESWKGWNLCLT